MTWMIKLSMIGTLLLSGHLDFLVWFFDAIALGVLLLGAILWVSANKLRKTTGGIAKAGGTALLVIGKGLVGAAIISLLFLAKA